jgi:hypothetical protein
MIAANDQIFIMLTRSTRFNGILPFRPCPARSAWPAALQPGAHDCRHYAAALLSELCGEPVRLADVAPPLLRGGG